ncbi:MAG TPA: hypothetical protein VFX39_04955, partial [Gemmatimonadaceae bacterium]|nr:hypothetical protein [Gemmatimonadaceae bacterium]
AHPVRDELMMRDDPSVRDLASEPVAPADPVQEAAFIPLGSPEAAAAEAQRLRSERGELPAEGDITPTGDDRRRRRRGRRGGRRARGRNGGSGGGQQDDGAQPGDASVDQGD